MSNIVKFFLYILLCIAIIVFFIVFDKKHKNEDEDERQKMYIGKAFQLGYYVTIFCNYLSFVACRIFEIGFHTEVLFLISIIIGAVCFLIYGIWKDCVFTKVATKKVWIGILIVCIAVIIRQIVFVLKSDAIENVIMLVLFSVGLAIIIINFIAKIIYDKKNQEE